MINSPYLISLEGYEFSKFITFSSTTTYGFINKSNEHSQNNAQYTAPWAKCAMIPYSPVPLGYKKGIIMKTPVLSMWIKDLMAWSIHFPAWFENS